MLLVIKRESANAVGREKLTFVEHLPQDASQAGLIDDREQATLSSSGGFHAGDVARQVRAIMYKPLHAPTETGQVFKHLRLKRLDGKERNQSDHRMHAHGDVMTVARVQHVIIEAVLFVP